MVRNAKKQKDNRGASTLVLLVARQRTALYGQRRDSRGGGDIREQATGGAGVPRIMGANLA